jgi:PPOX class probable F420-dependent enzyme
MQPLPDPVKQLIDDKSYANVATLMRDGSPQVTQTWVDHEGDTILINTFEGSQKYRNVLRNPKISMDICDPTSPYRVAMIRGRVSEVTFEGAEEHVNKLAKKYMGLDKYPAPRPGVRRVIIRIEPLHVTAPFMEQNSRWNAWRAQSSNSR